MPILSNPPETRSAATSHTATDWLDPLITAPFAKPGNWVLHAPNHHSAARPTTSRPRRRTRRRLRPTNWLGTDERGRDVVARLLYGFRVGMLFASG